MRRLNKKGETLVETLFAMLVIVLAFTVLCGGIVAAARINSRLKNSTAVFDTQGESSENKTLTVIHEGTGATESKLGITLHETENGYLYYLYP